MSLFRKCLAEFVGTYLLVLFGCGVVHTAVLTGAQVGLWQVAIVWGLGIMIAISVAGSTSGAHINPSITLALALRGRCPPSVVVPYILAQLGGAFVAAATLFVLFSPQLAAKEQAMGVERGKLGSQVTAMCYGEYFPNPAFMPADSKPSSETDVAKFAATVPLSTALLAETLGTLILALAVFAAIDPRNSVTSGASYAPVLIGLTVATLIALIAPLTQGCFNPARDFGPRLFAYLAGWGHVAIPGPWPDSYAFLKVYVAAPIVGAALGGFLYDLVLRPAKPSAEAAKA